MGGTTKNEYGGALPDGREQMRVAVDMHAAAAFASPTHHRAIELTERQHHSNRCVGTGSEERKREGQMKASCGASVEGCLRASKVERMKGTPERRREKGNRRIFIRVRST